MVVGLWALKPLNLWFSKPIFKGNKDIEFHHMSQVYPPFFCFVLFIYLFFGCEDEVKKKKNIWIWKRVQISRVWFFFFFFLMNSSIFQYKQCNTIATSLIQWLGGRTRQGRGPLNGSIKVLITNNFFQI